MEDRETKERDQELQGHRADIIAVEVARRVLSFA